jgi:hypothetical protein
MQEKKINSFVMNIYCASTQQQFLYVKDMATYIPYIKTNAHIVRARRKKRAENL